MKRVAILQSNYIPWKGYFDLIASVDEFILYDQVQFTKNDWRNRNKIKTPKGVEWLTVPVGKDINRTVKEVVLRDASWQKSHWKTLVGNYSRAPHFQEVAESLQPRYLEHTYTSLSELNRNLIVWACSLLGIRTRITDSADYVLEGDKSERLVNLCLQTGATEYVSGPAAKDYLRTELFTEKKIQVSWFDYSGYPEYPQLWGPFEHQVSVVDLLFNCGEKAPSFLKHVSPIT